VTDLSTQSRLDAVGFDNNTGGNICDLLKEGDALAAVNNAAPGLDNHSFYRSLYSFVAGVGPTVPNPGFPADRNDNASDFLFVDTNATNAAGSSQQRLGAPGPENLASPLVNNNMGIFLLDSSKSASQAPNRVRDTTSNPGNNATLGTLSVRRRFQNNTGANVTRLRFRIIDITTFPTPGGGVADLRAITSSVVSVSGVNDTTTCLAATGSSTTPCTLTVQGTTLEALPSQHNGGGFNSSVAAGTITTGTPLAPGANITLQFLLGVQTSGTFRFIFNVEAVP
jgi:hypothetical protein